MYAVIPKLLGTKHQKGGRELGTDLLLFVVGIGISTLILLVANNGFHSDTAWLRAAALPAAVVSLITGVYKSGPMKGLSRVAAGMSFLALIIGLANV
jgi:hypothetical protein